MAAGVHVLISQKRLSRFLNYLRVKAFRHERKNGSALSDKKKA
jgi:hypothetical protein